MLQNIFLWIMEHIFKIKTQTTPDVVSQNNDYQREYERIDQINFTSIFANKISNYVANDSNIDVVGTSERAKYFNEIAQSMKRKLKKISSTILGVGGIAIVPYVKKGKIYYNIVPQSRVLIDEKTGDLITGATILAESKVVSDLVSQKIYYRWSNYQIRNNNLIIQQKFTDENGNELKDTPEFWAGVQTILSISNVDRVPFGFIISPVNNRKPSDDYGVPITYGCDETIAEIRECLKQIVREFKTKEAFIGVDYTLFKKGDKKNSKDENNWGLPKDGIYRKFNSDKDDFWEVFSPEIRQSSYYERLRELYSRLEKEIGTSAGILTEIETENATATAIKRALFDTLTIVDDLRDNLEQGFDDFFRACDVLANSYNVVPSGTFEISYDWDLSLLEEPSETYNQYVQGVSQGVVKKEELRQFIFSDETLEESKKAIKEIEEETPSVDKLLEEDNDKDKQDDKEDNKNDKEERKNEKNND